MSQEVLDVPEAAPVPQVSVDGAGADMLVHRVFHAEGPADGPLLWDVMVRWFAGDPAGCVSWAEGWMQRWPTDRAPSTGAIGAVVTRHENSVEAHVTQEGRTLFCFSEGDGWEGRVRLMQTRGIGLGDVNDVAFYLMYAVTDLFYSETQVRLGSIPYLVSTPTTEDGQLDVATLRERLAGYGDLAVGAMDLFFALNRLEPTQPADAAGFADLTCRLWRPGEPVLQQDSHTAPLAGEVVAQWIAGGGLPERPVRHAEGGVVCDAVMYPVPLDTFGLPPLLAAARSSEVEDHRLNVHPEVDLSMTPAWTDLSAVWLDHPFDGRGVIPPRWLHRLAQGAGAGPGVVHLVASTLVHTQAESRDHAVAAAILMVERRRWSAGFYAQCCAHQLAQDVPPPLGRFVESWDRIMDEVGPGPIWPAAMTVLEQVAGRRPSPAGLADLLELLTRTTSRMMAPGLSRVLRMVLACAIPDAVVELAERPGRSRSQVEARALLATMRQASQQVST